MQKSFTYGWLSGLVNAKYYDKVEKDLDANTSYLKDLLKKSVPEEERIILEKILVKNEELKEFISREKIIRIEIGKNNEEMESLILRYKQLNKKKKQ